MELKFLFDIKDDNSWQRGLSVNLPNGHSFDILGTIFRYDRNSSNKELQREHDSYLGAKEQVLDIVYKGGILNVYINKGQRPGLLFADRGSCRGGGDRLFHLSAKGQ